MRKPSIIRALSLLVALTVTPAAAFAETGLSAADTGWMLTATTLVLFMTLPGLALFYGGLVRKKNVLSVLMQCFSIACVASLMWMFLVYGLAFGDGGAWQPFIGMGNLFASDLNIGGVSGSIPETVFFMFQMTFAIITPALIVGAFAERMRFSAVLWFTALWLILVYAPICHWVWGGGWLGERGFLDFAGGAVVHINAGVAALVAAIVIGRREGFPSTAMPPHNMALTVIGASMLWVGWFGFNAGSALAADGGAGMAMAVTHIAAATGSLAWVGCEWVRHGKPSVLGIVTGMVAGLGTITPASGFVGPLGALLIGLAAGVVCYAATQLIKRVLKIDDSLDVFPVHGVGGALGIMLTAVFYAPQFGGLADPGYAIAPQLWTQAVGVLATLVWCGLISFLILKVLDRLLGLRVSSEDETEGLDLVSHDEQAYHL